MDRTGSILAVDFGNVTTRVVLFDLVDGEYRVVGRGESLTTMHPPHYNITLGLRRVIRDLGNAMNRRFIDGNGQIITPEGADRSGVDYFITTASAGRPLRVVLVGLLPDISLDSAYRAISGAYVEVVNTIHLYNALTEEEQLNAILLSRPDVILITGGTDGGAKGALLSLMKGIRLALQVTDKNIRPSVIYAGNSKIVPQIKALFEDLTETLIANNIRPWIEAEQYESVQLEISKAYDTFKERQVGGFQDIAEISESGVLPTSQSYTLLAELIYKLEKHNVLVADMGSASTVIAGVFDGKLYTRISPQYGLGHSAKDMLNEIGADKIKAWLPFYSQPNEISNYALNKAVRPSSVPISLREAYLEHAFLRAGMQNLMEEVRYAYENSTNKPEIPPIETIVVGGSAITKVGNGQYSLLLVADSLQPRGISTVYADPYGVIPALGGLAQVNPLATVKLLEANNLELLGTLVSIEGMPNKNRVAARLRIFTENDKVDYELKGGQVLALSLPLGYTIEVQIRLQGGLTLNGKRRLRVKLQGGSGGILFDARGRSLNIGNTIEERAQNMPLWVQSATEDPLIPIPADWLIAPMPSTDDLTAEELDLMGDLINNTAKPTRQRWSLFGRGKAQTAKTAASQDDLENDEFMRALEDAEQPKSTKGGKKANDDMDELRGLL
jgi:hypothetical protein